MSTKSLRIAFIAALIAAMAACDSSALTAPEDAVENPQTRTACLAGGEVAVRAGCPDADNFDEEANQDWPNYPEDRDGSKPW